MLIVSMQSSLYRWACFPVTLLFLLCGQVATHVIYCAKQCHVVHVGSFALQACHKCNVCQPSLIGQAHTSASLSPFHVKLPENAT